MHDRSPLFPDIHARQIQDDHLAMLLRQNTPLCASDSATPVLDMTTFREVLATHDFSAAQDLNALLEWTVSSMKHGLVQMTHPRYFGLFNPGASYPAECADRVVAAFNPQICVWSHAPVAVEIERHVIEQVALRAGLGENAGGHFTSGGSEANHTAVICALTTANEDFADKGAFAFAGQPRIYASAESHLAWVKIAHQTGIGRDAVRLVDTDGRGMMDAGALNDSMQNDLAAGDVPVFVAATAGTTNAGMVDPLQDCADIAARYHAWYHVDAAWGGALIASQKYVSVLDGISRADSITIDAHKWFATTMGAGMFLTPHREVLNKTFRITASYMPSNNKEVDFYVNSMQWSRRFIGLRLFLSLATAGWAGYAAHVERGIGLIRRLIDALVTKGWRHVNSSQMAVACLLPPPGGESVSDCVERVVASGHSWISVARFESQSVVRVCVTNGRTGREDIDALIEKLISG